MISSENKYKFLSYLKNRERVCIQNEDTGEKRALPTELLASDHVKVSLLNKKGKAVFTGHFTSLEAQISRIVFHSGTRRFTHDIERGGYSVLVYPDEHARAQLESL